METHIGCVGRVWWLGLLGMCGGLTLSCAAAAPAQPSTPSKGALHLGVRDFDFNFGCWKINNHRLKHMLQGSQDWEDFETRQAGGPILAGLGNYDEISKADGSPVGFSLHLYNLESKRWSSAWVSSRDGSLQPPVIGGFSGDQGYFEGTDSLRGKPIQVRNVWSALTTPHPRWEQAFSGDAGQTWETNWIMNYTRIACPLR